MAFNTAAKMRLNKKPSGSNVYVDINTVRVCLESSNSMMAVSAREQRVFSNLSPSHLVLISLVERQGSFWGVVKHDREES